jgi:hypothetical protein
MPLPPGSSYGDIGKKYFFIYFIFLCFSILIKDKLKMKIFFYGIKY